MSNLPLEVVEMFGQTIAKVVPVTIGLALVFSVLTHFWACNPGKPWWRKRELVTDICYWFFVPLFARVLRIGLLVLGAGVLFNIHDADELIAFYDNGHGPLAELPLWFQAVLFLVLSDFMLYWLHRMFHGGGFWKYHADPSFVRGSGLDFGGALPPRQPVPRNHPRRRLPADGGHFAERHALGRALQHVPFGVRPRQSELDARPVQIRARHARCSTAGITPRWKRAATPILPAPFRSGTSCSGPSGCRKTSCPIIMASTTRRRSRRRLPGNWPIRSGQLGVFRAKWVPVCARTAVTHRRAVRINRAEAGSDREARVSQAPFALRSHIEVRFAPSGAGSAAYRFCRLVNAPG